MEKDYFNKEIYLFTLALALFLSFLILKPILISLFIGLILAIIFFPVFDYMKKFFKYKSLTAIILILILILIVLIPLFFLVPLLIKESVKIYLLSQQKDFLSPLFKLLPQTFLSSELYKSLAPTTYSFVATIGKSFVNWLTSFIYDFPKLSLQLLVVLFTFFFTVVGKEEFLSYIRDILPFSKKINEKLLSSSKDIIFSIVYGQLFVGMIQGIIIGIGFFIVGINDALILTFLAVIFGVIPIIGTMIVWAPVLIYLIIKGKILASIVILIFGIISSHIDYPLRTFFVSKRTKIHPSLILLGMLGGFLFMGISGFVLGPLVLSYLMILLEIYKKNKSDFKWN